MEINKDELNTKQQQMSSLVKVFSEHMFVEVLRTNKTNRNDNNGNNSCHLFILFN